MYSSFVRSIQSFVCLAEPEAGAGGHGHSKKGPEETTDVTAAAEAAPAAESEAQGEGGLAPRVAARSAPGSGASTHPVG